MFNFFVANEIKPGKDPAVNCYGLILFPITMVGTLPFTICSFQVNLATV